MKLTESWREFISKDQVIPGLIAGLALIVSIHSCRIAEKGTEIAFREFEEERILVLQGMPSETAYMIRIQPIEDHIRLLKARAIYPSQLRVGEVSIDPPNYDLALTVPTLELAKLLDASIEPSKDHFLFMPMLAVPLAIESYYVAHGHSYQAMGLYRLEFSAIIDDMPLFQDDFSLKGMIFLSHVDLEQDVQAIVDKLWEQGLRELAKLEEEHKSVATSSSQ